MTDDRRNDTPPDAASAAPAAVPNDPAEVVEAWNDLVLFAAASGNVLRAEGDGPCYLPRAAATGSPFWASLELGTGSLRETLERFQPFAIHEVDCGGGRRFLLRIIPLAGELAERGGYVVVATDNRPMEALYETYEERMGDNISAWSDSITLFNALFDTAKDATFLIDESGRILSANAAAVASHACPGRELSGRDFTALLGRRFHGPMKRAMETLRPRQLWTEQVSAQDGEGEAFPAEALLRRIEFTGYSLFQLILHDLSVQMELKEDLRDREAEVKNMNIALRQVIKAVEEDRQELREHLTSRMKKQMLPALERIAKEEAPEIREGYRSVIEEQLVGMTNGASGEMDADLLRLSPREMEVCRFIQLGRSGKEIAEMLNLSFETIQAHRKNIRRKLDLRGERTSLFAYLRRKPSLS